MFGGITIAGLIPRERPGLKSNVPRFIFHIIIILLSSIGCARFLFLIK